MFFQGVCPSGVQKSPSPALVLYGQWFAMLYLDHGSWVDACLCLSVSLSLFLAVPLGFIFIPFLRIYEGEVKKWMTIISLVIFLFLRTSAGAGVVRRPPPILTQWWLHHISPPPWVQFWNLSPEEIITIATHWMQPHWSRGIGMGGGALGAISGCMWAPVAARKT